MLNYIWAGLLVAALCCALIKDVGDLQHNTYRNGLALPVTITPKSEHNVDLTISPADYKTFYGREGKLAPSYAAILDGETIKFGKGEALPEPLLTVRDWAGESEITATLQNENGHTSLLFHPVRFVKLNAISKAGMETAKTAVTFALDLIGVLALWSGLIKIAEAAGLLNIIVKVTQPILRPLFPGVPKDHPALANIALNITAGMLSLGNAGTPLGIKAMEQLQELNKKKDTASNAMIMLLVLNTTAISLVPSPTTVAFMGLQFSTIYFPTIVCAGCCAIVGIAVAKFLEIISPDPVEDRVEEAVQA